MMDTELIAAARKLAAEARERANATPLGPWSWSQTYEMFGGYYHWSLKNPRAKVEGKTIDGGFVMLHSGPDYFSEPWEKRPIPVFVAAARTDVPALADLVDQLAAELERAWAERDEWKRTAWDQLEAKDTAEAELSRQRANVTITREQAEELFVAIVAATGMLTPKQIYRFPRSTERIKKAHEILYYALKEQDARAALHPEAGSE